MHRAVDEGRTLLVSGSASVTLLKGKAKAIGATLLPKKKVVIKRGKTVPFEAAANSVFEVVTGVGGSVEEVDGSTIPEAWKKTVEQISASPRPCRVMILGEVDCGKTTFSIFLANNLASKSKIAVIDADPGQSDIGSPATIGLGLVTKPITDLFSAETVRIGFIGSTSPSGVESRVLKELAELNIRASEMAVDYVIINTDGWVQGDDARNYKITMIELVSPDIVIGIQHSDELEHVLTAAEEKGFRTYTLPSSTAVKKRSKEERRRLREQGYRKFLKNTILRPLPMSWVRLENTFLDTEKTSMERLEELEALLGHKILYVKEKTDTLIIVLKKAGRFEGEMAKIPTELFGKKVRAIGEGDEGGLLVGLLDGGGEFLGLGAIQEIDYENRVLKLLTPYAGKVDVVRFSQVKVDSQGGEVGLTTAFSESLCGQEP